MKADRHLGRQQQAVSAVKREAGLAGKSKRPGKILRCEVMTASKRKPKTGFRFKVVFFWGKTGGLEITSGLNNIKGREQ